MKKFSFDEKTPVKVQQVLTAIYASKVRVRVWLGDTATGEAWPEEHDVLGVIGSSTGMTPIPLLINNSRSLGGHGVLDNCIVRIDRTDGGGTIYKHANFNHGITVQGLQVFAHGVLHANCQSEEKAQRLAAFLKGERYSK